MGSRIWVATRKGLFRIDREPGGWRVADCVFLGDRVDLVSCDARDGGLYAALNHGHFGVKLHRSMDGGHSWREVAAPQFPPKPDDFVDPPGRTPVPWNTEQIWAITPGHKDEPGKLWIGTIPGGLFVSRDHAETWQLVRGLWDHPSRREWFGGGADQPGIHSVLVDPRDGRHVSIGVSCGGAWVSRDGGETWIVKSKGMVADYMPPERREDPNVQDPHRIVQCLEAPDVLWCQHHNGIFRSTDGSESWQRIEDVAPSTFGFAVAVHPRRPEIAWFVPATSDQKRVPVAGQVVVTRTHDGGASWETLREGLPQRHAYDLVYRHGLDVDDTGQWLAMGSTTGAVWVSEDRGDTWRVVSAHLPPVYCVHFEHSTC